MMQLNDWLHSRTFHYSAFNNLAELVERKKQRNVSISLCFPTLNEEKTIAKSLVIMKSELMDRYPLIDEIAVIDSGSSDNTIAIARSFGADTYLSSEYLADQGSFKGKGDNLWKALFLLKGDIIVYIDADISNIHHRFAYGLIGPLLMDDTIKFVKAFYNRPFKDASGIRPKGGGRVTEILIRPLFSQFYPDLSGIIQPLSGEYAGYRDILEQIPFPVGYGVETGMLIDIYQKWGLDVIAQTNLDFRIHRNQSLSSLGRMSFGIMQIFWDRLKKYKENVSVEPESLVLRQIELLEEIYNINTFTIQEHEHQPIIDVPAYREKFVK